MMKSFEELAALETPAVTTGRFGPGGQRLDDAQLRQIHARVMSLPIVRHLRMDVSFSMDGVVEARLPSIEPFHLGGHHGDAVNGAVILSLLYCTIVCPGLLYFSNCSTLQFDSKLLKPVSPNNVKARGYAYAATRKMVFCKAFVSDVDDEPRAIATGIVVRI
ncbi:MAG: PaaI family thioesterase [Sulfurifustis sp.]